MLAPVQVAGAGAVAGGVASGALSTSAVRGIALQTGIGTAANVGLNAAFGGQTSPAQILQNALTGATTGEISGLVIGALPIKAAVETALTKLGAPTIIQNLAEAGRLGVVAKAAIETLPESAREAVNLGNWFAIQKGLDSMSAGRVPTLQELATAYETGAIVGAIFPEVGPVMRAATATTATTTPTATSAIVRLFGEMGGYGTLGVAGNIVAGSPMPWYEAALLGAGIPVLTEEAGSIYGLGKAGIMKAIAPGTTTTGMELPSSDIYAEVTTPEGQNLRIYRGTTQEVQSLNDLEKQVKQSINVPPESGYATGIHMTLNRDVLNDLKNGGTLVVQSPVELGKGFRSLFATDQFGNPLYLAPSKAEGAVNVEQAYGGYVGLGENAESSGKVVKSKNFVAQTNEVLCKLIAYNITVLINAMYELGVNVNLSN